MFMRVAEPMDEGGGKNFLLSGAASYQKYRKYIESRRTVWVFYNNIQPGNDFSEIYGKRNSREEEGQAFDVMKGGMQSDMT